MATSIAAQKVPVDAFGVRQALNFESETELLLNHVWPYAL